MEITMLTTMMSAMNYKARNTTAVSPLLSHIRALEPSEIGVHWQDINPSSSQQRTNNKLLTNHQYILCY